ncbi:hypothetical protein NDU88_002394 [Pleurodeles waltl]|uniref:Uncharacterized protein n=1 Tax=Pleurodeles waltl TaxID=8319 RepID=A0AAV7NN07_PLEWA|nr:hypothetical protein NDU88_002394 [Pleurodeles waltl]
MRYKCFVNLLRGGPATAGGPPSDGRPLPVPRGLPPRAPLLEFWPLPCKLRPPKACHRVSPISRGGRAVPLCAGRGRYCLHADFLFTPELGEKRKQAAELGGAQ